MSKERIVYAVVDVQRVTLYREDGSTIEIPQSDPRVKTVVDQVMPLLQSQSVAEVDLTYLPSTYKDYEKKSSGLVKFFKVAKKAVAGLFKPADEEVTVPVGQFGIYPVAAQVPATPATLEATKMAAAVDEIMAQAQSVNHPDFVDPESDKEEEKDQNTMIAVVTDANDPNIRRVIPGVEALKEQLSYFAHLGSTKGMDAFFARLAPVMDKRSHSVEDLLKFLKRCDLPITDDGCFISYKILRRKDNHFVDCHTNKVHQRVGSYVCVDEELVDKNRDRDCSNGLHIAARGYVRAFGGDVVTLCKIRPEDVMTVPYKDATKIRVCGYHILFEMDNNSYTLLQKNKPATTNKDAADKVTKAITGQHAPPIEEVRITKQMGEGIIITPLDRHGRKVNQNALMASTVSHKALDDSSANSVDPKTVIQKVNEVKKTNTRQTKAYELLAIVKDTDPVKAHQAAKELLEFKAKSKVSWSLLGINDAQLKLVNQKASRKPVEPTKPASPPLEKKPLTRAEQVRQEVLRMNNQNLKNELRVEAANKLLEIRKSAKVSWDKLGQPNLSNAAIQTTIDKLTKRKASQKNAVDKVMTQVEKSKKATKPAPTPVVDPLEGLSPVQREARMLYDENNWAGLVAFKKKKKKSFAALGFDAEQINVIMLHNFIGD